MGRDVVGVFCCLLLGLVLGFLEGGYLVLILGFLGSVSVVLFCLGFLFVL